MGSDWRWLMEWDSRLARESAQFGDSAWQWVMASDWARESALRSPSAGRILPGWVMASAWAKGIASLPAPCSASGSAAPQVLRPDAALSAGLSSLQPPRR